MKKTGLPNLVQNLNSLVSTIFYEMYIFQMNTMFHNRPIHFICTIQNILDVSMTRLHR